MKLYQVIYIAHDQSAERETFIRLNEADTMFADIEKAKDWMRKKAAYLNEATGGKITYTEEQDACYQSKFQIKIYDSGEYYHTLRLGEISLSLNYAMA